VFPDHAQHTTMSAIPHGGVRTAAHPEWFVVQQRLLVAEEQTEALVHGIGSLGVCRDQMLDSLLQTLKLETERELDPTDTGG